MEGDLSKKVEMFGFFSPHQGQQGISEVTSVIYYWLLSLEEKYEREEKRKDV